MKYKSASAQIVNFLKGKELGYEFTAKSLYEDIATTPGEPALTSDGAVNGCLVKQRRYGALTARAIRTHNKGTAYMYTLADHDKLRAQNRRSIGSKPGRHPSKPPLRDIHIEGRTKPDLFNGVNVEELERGMLPPTTRLGNDPVPDGKSANAPSLTVTDEVKYHLRMAFKAYKRQFLAGKVLLTEASTSDIMAELQRRLDAKRERDAEKSAG